MRKLMVGATLWVILLFLGMANVGCDGASTSWNSAVTPANPINSVTPVQPSTGMVAFIEDVGGASTFNAASTWKEQAASNPGVNSATRNVYAMNSKRLWRLHFGLGILLGRPCDALMPVQAALRLQKAERLTI